MRTTVPPTEPLGDHGCQVAGVNFAVETGVPTDVIFNTEIKDTDDYSDEENPPVIPEGQDGTYLVVAELQGTWEESPVAPLVHMAVTLFPLQPAPLGNARQWVPMAPSGSIGSTGNTVSMVRELTAGQSVFVTVAHNSSEPTLNFTVTLTLQRLA